MDLLLVLLFGWAFIGGDRTKGAESSLMSTEIRSSLDDPVVEGDLARARAGDAAAFDRLVRPLRVALHAHCYRMLGSAHDADDAVQDALLRAWRKLSGFESRSSFRNWLYAVATRCCLDALAQRRR